MKVGFVELPSKPGLNQQACSEEDAHGEEENAQHVIAVDKYGSHETEGDKDEDYFSGGQIPAKADPEKSLRRFSEPEESHKVKDGDKEPGDRQVDEEDTDWVM